MDQARSHPRRTFLKIAPPFHRNLTAVEFPLVLDTRLFRLLPRSFPGIAPAEVVKLPVCVRGEDEIPDRKGDQVDHHPQHVRPSVRGHDDEDARQTENESEEDEWDDGDWLFHDGNNNQVERKGDSGREHQSPDQLDEYHELHAETERAAQISYQHQLHEVVNRAVDPSSTLREQDGELFGYGGLAHRLRDEHLFAFGECFKHQRRKVAIFSEEKQVLFV